MSPANALDNHLVTIGWNGLPDLSGIQHREALVICHLAEGVLSDVHDSGFPLPSALPTRPALKNGIAKRKPRKTRGLAGQSRLVQTP